MDIAIIGVGNLGRVILRALETEYNVQVYADKNVSHHIDDKIVLVVVKPNAYQKIKFSGTPKAIISLMAGVELKDLKEFFGAKFTMRAMPNLAASYQASATAFCGDIEFKEQTAQILKSFGSSFWLENENDMNIATALAGSGPAFVALVAESLSDGAVRMGLKRELANKITQKLLEGTAKILNDIPPADLKDKVMSPGGTTAKGYYMLEKNRVRAAFIKAIEQASNTRLFH